MKIPYMPVSGALRDVYAGPIPDPDDPKYIMIKKLEASLNYPSSISVSYPSVQINIGDVELSQSLFGEEKRIIIKAITFEETSKVEQEFVLSPPSADGSGNSLPMPSSKIEREIYTLY